MTYSWPIKVSTEKITNSERTWISNFHTNNLHNDENSKKVINVGDILREVKLYTEYVKDVRMILVSTVPLTKLEHQALSDEGVVVVVLGESFERWKASRMAEAAAGV